MSKPISVHCHSDASTLASAFTERLKQEMAAIGETPTGIMLSGGSTPLGVYQAIAQKPLEHVGSGLRLFMSDERHVPRDDPGNNFHQASQMFSALALGPEQLIPVQTELETAEAAAAEYNRAMASFFEAGGTIPLGILGMGPDGHTASLFTKEQIDAADGHFAIAVDRPDGRRGITLTISVFERIESLVFLVAGASKQAQVQNLLERPQSIPAGIIVSRGQHTELWCDEAALVG